VRRLRGPVTDVLLRLVGVTRRFEGLTAVNACSLDVAPGAVHGLIRPNGAGKTTLVEMISGALPPSAGSILLGGEPIEGRPPHEVAQRGVSRTFQLTSLFREMSVLDNVMVGMHTRLRAGPLASMLGTRAARREDAAARVEAAELLDLLLPGVLGHVRPPCVWSLCGAGALAPARCLSGTCPSCQASLVRS